MKFFLLFLTFIFFIRPIDGDGDFFHHLNSGKYVVEHKSLPYVDEFTHTAQGKEWVGYTSFNLLCEKN